MKEVTIIDYGMSNLLSIQRAIEHVGGKVKLSSDPNEIVASDYVILPGVGAFPNGMQELNMRNLPEAIGAFTQTGKPFLGICLGMQMMLSHGEEGGGALGLNLIQGNVRSLPRFQKNGIKNKIPNMCWSEVNFFKEIEHTPFKNIPQNAYMYFVHSYFAKPTNENHVFATSKFGDIDFCCAIRSENSWGMQFHPEKSGKDGLLFLQAFLDL